MTSQKLRIDKMDNVEIIKKISLNFYILQAAKTLLTLLMIFSAHIYLLTVPLGFGFVCLALQITTLTSAHHNYTASLAGGNKWYLHTVIIDLLTTTMIFANSIFLCVGVIKL